MTFEKVLSPIKVGSIELKNRFVMPAMGSGMPNQDGSVSEQVIEYFAARAKGGFGLCITEFCFVDPAGMAQPGQLAGYDDKFILGLTELADAIHKNGAKAALQLHHAGRATSRYITGLETVAPSPIPDPVIKEIPHELTIPEIYEIIEKFGDAGRRAKKAGFDAVEIHGAHGYLVCAFLSPYSNKRTDEFGGPIEGRVRFATKIIENIKRKCGADFPVGIRISADERVVGGLTISESKSIASELEKAGANWLNISTGLYSTLMWTIAPGAVPPGVNIDAAAEIKKVVKIPVIGVGRINDPHIAESIIASGSADLVALGRASIADPEFPNKVAESRIDEISPCISCQQRCMGQAYDSNDTGISCMINPFSGKEGVWSTQKAEKPKKIVVVGAGPSGLEAAWIAAERGHSVTVFEKETEPGGQFRLAAIPPTKQDFARAIKFYMTMGKKTGATFKFGTEATVDLITAEKPDEVVLATGGIPLIPKIPGIDAQNVVNAVDVLKGRVYTGDNVLVIGGGMVGVETADFLASQLKKVTIVEMLPEIAAAEPASTKFFLFQRLRGGGVVMMTDTKVTAITENGVICNKADNEQKLEGFDTIVLALGAQAFNPLEDELKSKGLSVHVIGDAVKARKALEAIYEGAKLAMSI